jgi:hypothetical protein
MKVFGLDPAAVWWSTAALELVQDDCLRSSVAPWFLPARLVDAG